MATIHDERRQDMVNLRYVLGWTLQKIADRYGISRERVRQIIGNSGHIAIKTTDRLKDEEFLQQTANLTNEELADMLGVSQQTVAKHRGDMRHAIKNGNSAAYRGAMIEDKVSEILKEKGISNELMPFKNGFDILALDTVRIDVKSAYKNWNPPSSNFVSPLWRFKIQSGVIKRKGTDFYACYIVPTEELFVIPSNVIPETREYIAFCWPTTRPTMSKYQKYLNAYHLITEFAEESMLSITPPIESVPENISV